MNIYHNKLIAEPFNLEDEADLEISGKERAGKMAAPP